MEIKLSQETISKLHQTLNTNKISLNRIDDKYTLNIGSTNMKTKFGKEMAASVASIQLYQEIATDQETLNFDTVFEINYSDLNEKFSYNLKSINNAINAENTIDNFIEELKANNSIRNHSICDSNFENLKKLKIEDFAFGGFKQKQQSICGVNRNVTIWIMFILPENKKLNFYVDNTNNKIVKTEEPR